MMGCEGWNVCTARALLFLGLLPDCPFPLKYFEIGFILERGVYFDRSIVSVLSVCGKEGAAFFFLFFFSAFRKG